MRITAIKKSPDIRYLIKAAIYIAETESENYLDHCSENNFDPKNYAENGHVYGYAILGLGEDD